MQYDFCLAQEQITTSYQNEGYGYLDILLNGKVKFLKRTSYDPSKLCDSVPCEKITIIYLFDTNLLPEKINYTRFYIASNKSYREEEIYKFKNGNLVLSRVKNSSRILEKEVTKYKYNSKGNIVSMRSHWLFFCLRASYKYDNQDRLIQIKEKAGVFPIRFYADIETYKYDTMGNLVEKSSSTKSEYESIKRFVYDENNRLIKKDDISEGQTYDFMYYYKYDEKGNKIEEKTYRIKEDTVLSRHRVYQYNENGQEIRKYEIKGYGFGHFGKYKTLTKRYDENKNLIQEEHIRDNQTVGVIRYIYSYDSQDNWVKRETYSGNNEEDLSKRLTEERIIEYY